MHIITISFDTRTDFVVKVDNLPEEIMDFVHVDRMLRNRTELTSSQRQEILDDICPETGILSMTIYISD